MNAFVLDEDHLVFRDNIRKFAREKFIPGQLARAASTEYPRAELRELADAGLTALAVPEELGGQGADLLALGIAAEELGYACSTMALAYFFVNVQTSFLAAHAPAAVREEWLPTLISGEAIGCTALTEPGTGSDASALTCRAERVEGGWKLYGEKSSITQAPHADFAAVIAQTEPGKRAKGIGAFAVPLNDPTIARQAFHDPGCKAIGRGALTFDGTFVPDSHVMIEPGGGFHGIMREFDLTRTLIGLMVIGTAQRAIDMTVEYTKQRTTFGQPLAVNQGVQFPLAEHSTYITAVRALAYQTLGLRMAGEPHTAQAAMLKWWAPQVAMAAINDCVVLHGHIGWSEEMPLQAMLRDVSGYQIGDGTPQIQKMIIARDLYAR
ncbi:acyl-CoA dehydrogenase family protein [Nocardia sp. NEAU-G5]|uniref:Acyl-CoA dehydrogenase family protein n=1 Tax=Nocardia albiluteola TaxID=2842303 RepID=A0ABS6B9P9_9NOCA|nr:acyl-CoA dehydrogenase family protein [Nocardia albiluteola]MBU3067025.1 acyl-CoA dehydrogenase family protein [Nocardia albiluteola]